MTITAFPSIDRADEDGLLALGGDLDLDSLLLAYRSGVFPWPLNRRVLAWFAPPTRALLFLDRLHVPRSLRKFRNRTRWTIDWDRNFSEVIAACAAPVNRGDQNGTWITPAIIEGYTGLHRAGYAHSIECYEDEQLVGGLYGVSIGMMFAGESMFYRKPNASKLALIELCLRLADRGAHWIDCQVMTPTVASLGAIEIERAEFMQLLRDELCREGNLFGTA